MQRYEFFLIFVPYYNRNMEQNVIQQNMWNLAGRAGLVLGAVSTAYLFLTQWLAMNEVPALMLMFISMLLWAGKFAACIFLMTIYMKRFSSENPEADRRAVFRAGMAIALLSALVYSAFAFANIAFIYPDYLTEQISMMMEQLAPMLDSNTLNEMEKTMQNLPQMTFFSNLIYCFIYGTFLSSIISRLISRQAASTGYKPEEN